MPPGNIFFGNHGPYDILAVTGLVVDGNIHAHIAFPMPSTLWVVTSKKAALCSPSLSSRSLRFPRRASLGGMSADRSSRVETPPPNHWNGVRPLHADY